MTLRDELAEAMNGLMPQPFPLPEEMTDAAIEVFRKWLGSEKRVTVGALALVHILSNPTRDPDRTWRLSPQRTQSIEVLTAIAEKMTDK